MIFIYTIQSFALTNGSVKCEGKLLNDIIHPRPKLKQDLINVLLIFQRYPIALVCNIAKMSLRICSIDQPYQRILRSLKQNEEPRVLQFTIVVFGSTFSLFHAQFKSQEHDKNKKPELPEATDCLLLNVLTFIKGYFT